MADLFHTREKWYHDDNDGDDDEDDDDDKDNDNGGRRAEEWINGIELDDLQRQSNNFKHITQNMAHITSLPNC